MANHKNGSILISSDVHGIVKPNLVSTFGCRVPILPTTFPYATISPQRLGKNVASENIK